MYPMVPSVQSPFISTRPSFPIPCVFSIPKILPHRAVWLASGSPPPDAPQMRCEHCRGTMEIWWILNCQVKNHHLIKNLAVKNHDSSAKHQ